MCVIVIGMCLVPVLSNASGHVSYLPLPSYAVSIYWYSRNGVIQYPDTLWVALFTSFIVPSSDMHRRYEQKTSEMMHQSIVTTYSAQQFFTPTDFSFFCAFIISFSFLQLTLFADFIDKRQDINIRLSISHEFVPFCT